MIAALLVAMAVLDAALCGFRDAAGRNPRIEKRAYYRRAILRGARAGAAAVVLLGALTGAALLASPDPGALYADLVAAGARMVVVYGAYATLVGVALLIYALPVPDLRILATVSILGPFTMMRPWVIAAGALWGAATAARPAAACLALLSAAVIASIERLLGRAWREGPAVPP